MEHFSRETTSSIFLGLVRGIEKCVKIVLFASQFTGIGYSLTISYCFVDSVSEAASVEGELRGVGGSSD